MKQRVVIIGGSSGMGLAIAKLLAAKEYEVVLAGRSTQKLEKAQKEIGKKVETHAFDVSNEKEVALFFSKTSAFDHLVVSAAGFLSGPFLESDVTQSKNYFNSKFWGQFTAAKYASSKLHKEGSIIFFSGAVNQKPAANFSVAGSVNAAVEALTRALALELSPVRVNAIAPGVIVTPVWDAVPKEESSAFFANVASALPVKHVGKPESIALAALFLIECTYTTGSVVHVDGGFRLI